MSKKKTQAAENGTDTAEAPQQEQAAPPAPAMASPFGDLDQVRQILFGAESEEIHQRLVNIEAHFNDVIAALKDSVDKQFKAMEASVKKQNDALSKRLTKEKELRTEADADLAQDLQENRAQLDDRIDETERAFRQELKAEADNAAEDRDARFADVSARLEQAVAQLSDAKTDRHGLADLLDQLSAGLRNSQ